MTVKELIAKLSALDPLHQDLRVVIPTAGEFDFWRISKVEVDSCEMGDEDAYDTVDEQVVVIR